jgi:tRNA modification GTPase
LRVSGTAAAAVGLRLTGVIPQPRRAALGWFHDPNGNRIDQGIALYFPAPHSFTGEDVLELQGHGSPIGLGLLLRACVAAGARLAEPGEFTRRAFLNGKLDLAQAESVADLIEASTEAAARSAARSLSGAFSLQIRELVGGLTELRVLVEATLDFPEEQLDILASEDSAGRLAALRRKLEQVRQTAHCGSLMRNGLHVVLAGAPNVGKSSLLNRLAGAERAIVTEIAGTTRDAVRETIQIAGIPLHVVDTAGLRSADDRVERLGIDRAWREIEQADVVLLMADARTGITSAEHEIWRRLPHKVETLVALNKADLAGVAGGLGETEFGVGIYISALTGDGIDVLQGELLRVAGWRPGVEEPFIARERHVAALATADEHLVAAAGLDGRPELVAEELRLAQEALGAITGEFTSEELLGEIFGRFCIGK